MNHSEILKKSWDKLWRYRALWVFGIMLALTTSSWESAFMNGGSGGGNNINYTIDSEAELQEDLRELAALTGIEEVPKLASPEVGQALLVLAIAIGVALLVLMFVFTIMRYLGETALIKMVDEHEENDRKVGIREGLRMGWSRSAWRLFLIDLLVSLPIMFVFMVLMGLILVPVLLGIDKSPFTTAMGVITTVGLFFVLLAAVVIVAAVLSLLSHFFRRVCVLEDRGVTDSIRTGYRIVRQNMKDVGLMWLITIVIGVMWPLVMLPISLLLMSAGVAVGGLLGLGVFAMASSGMTEVTSIILGVLTGLPVFLLILILPMTLLSGLKQVFLSSVWTLSYRDLRPDEKAAKEKLADIEFPGPMLKPSTS